MKIICAVTMMGPNWWLKRALEQVTHTALIHHAAKDVTRCGWHACCKFRVVPTIVRAEGISGRHTTLLE